MGGKGKAKGKGNSKGEGKSKASGKKPNMPSELREFPAEDKAGRRVCYAYNLAQGCSRATSGNPPACERGTHKCIKCGGMGHGLQSCPKA